MQRLGACEQQRLVRPRTSGVRVVARQLPAGSAFRAGSHLLVRPCIALRSAPRLSAVKTSAVLEMSPTSKDLSGNGIESSKDDVGAIKEDILRQAKYTVGAKLDHVKTKEAYQATAYSVAERLVDDFDKTNEYWKEKDPKFVYYLSAEFLMGRTLINALHNMDVTDEYKTALKELGYSLEDIYDQEQDASLGNGGLGRLAACFLDSMATLDLPGWGYGIRYHYGLFKQSFVDDVQQEVPDYWLDTIGVGTPWEIARPNIRYKVGFFGEATDNGWTPAEEVWAQAYDTPIPGFATTNCGNLRLWESFAVEQIDLQAFNDGDYIKAADQERKAKMITAVLYPNDNTEEGKLLRLKQQYFFTSASLQDALARFKETHKDNWDMLPERVCVQMNDTHPTSAVGELMRLLIDQEGLSWDKAWELTKKTLAFTNHTVLPEALERWNVEVYQKLLPRNYAIIERINKEWLAEMTPFVTKKVEAEGLPPPKVVEEVDKKTGEVKEVEVEVTLEEAVAERLSKQYAIIAPNMWNDKIIEVNMAILAIVGSKAVNGVAAIHSEILKLDLFKQFYELWPEKFQNKTNGVTPRRWLAECNQPLYELISETLGGTQWEKDLDQLQDLIKHVDDPVFLKKWADAKMKNKERLAKYIKAWTGVEIPTHFLFDVMIKRIHEYKRQHMNVFSVIHRYMELKAMTPEERAKQVPRAVIIGGKAASAYYMAKRIISLALAVSRVVNDDPDVKDVLKVVYVPDYNVSKAEIMIPGAELSQHISTAGTEASGTSNMKFAMNACLIIGTLDGANIEIAECAGQEKLFIFGMLKDEVPEWRESKRKVWNDYCPEWVAVMKAITDGMFGPGFEDVVDNVNDMTKSNDWFLVAPDFAAYLEAQKKVDEAYLDQETWTKHSVYMTATSGKFNSDRTINQYADEIWDVKPCRVE